MTQYQNLFTTVTVEAPGHSGVALGHGNSPRSLDPPVHFYWLGKLGNAQLGPIYLGSLGLFLALAAVLFSALCIVISGPFWSRGWPEWWGWWLNMPIWR